MKSGKKIFQWTAPLARRPITARDPTQRILRGLEKKVTCFSTFELANGCRPRSIRMCIIIRSFVYKFAFLAAQCFSMNMIVFDSFIYANFAYLIRILDALQQL